MPNYTFKNHETGEEFTESMSMSARETYLAENPHITQLLVSAIPQGDPIRLGMKKPDDGFRDVLREVKKKHPLGRGINTF